MVAGRWLWLLWVDTPTIAPTIPGRHFGIGHLERVVSCQFRHIMNVPCVYYVALLPPTVVMFVLSPAAMFFFLFLCYFIHFLCRPDVLPPYAQGGRHFFLINDDTTKPYHIIYKYFFSWFDDYILRLSQSTTPSTAWVVVFRYRFFFSFSFRWCSHANSDMRDCTIER